MAYRSKGLFHVITESWTFQHMNAGSLSVFSFIFFSCGMAATYLGIHDGFLPSLLGGPFLGVIGIILFVKAREKRSIEKNRKRNR